jgi:hypothetical protein
MQASNGLLVDQLAPLPHQYLTTACTPCWGNTASTSNTSARLIRRDVSSLICGRGEDKRDSFISHHVADAKTVVLHRADRFRSRKKA